MYPVRNTGSSEKGKKGIKTGSVNAAFFGSPRMADERTIVMGCSNNRTFKNLQENPQVCFLVMEPGKRLPEWREVRIYARMREADTSGEQYRSVKTAIVEDGSMKVALGLKDAGSRRWTL